MAKEEVSIELAPTFSRESLDKLKQSVGDQFKDYFSGGHGSKTGGAIGLGAGLVAGGAAAIGGAAMSTVGTANPAVMEMFNQSLEDITGVIGQSLVPVLELMTEGARMFGDFLASIMPDTATVLDPLKDVMNALKEAIDPLIPLIKDFLAGSLEALAWTVRQVADSMVWLLNKMGAGSGSSTNNWSSSVGAAAKGSEYSSASNLSKGAIAGAYGMGGGANPAERTAKSAEQIAADVSKIVDTMYSGTGGDFGGFPNE